jgi:dTDP-4-dehydrorhamnose reductase
MQNAARLLVTGASGFLGAHVVERALAEAWEVRAQVHRAPLPESLSSRVQCVNADFSSEAELEHCLESTKPEVVIHLAARSSVADGERDQEFTRRVNVCGPRLLASWCARRGARLVHVSTDLVFGGVGPPEGGFSESDLPAPISAYGRSKLAAERAIEELDPLASIVRLPLLVGPSHGRGLGATDSLLAAVDRGETPALFEDEWRTPLDVRSAAEALIELASSDLAGHLHVAGPERISRHEIGMRALRRRGLRADLARARLVTTTRGALGLASTRPADVSLNSTRAKRVLRTLLIGLESGSH